MWQPFSLATCALLMIGGAAAAQTAPAGARAACDTHVVPAYAKAGSTSGRTVDCPCMAGFLTGRYGPADAEIVMRIFAAAANESREQVQTVNDQFGAEQVRRVLTAVGKFQDLGREMDKACPAVPAKP
jgi:hypothetical protein